MDRNRFKRNTNTSRPIARPAERTPQPISQTRADPPKDAQEQPPIVATPPAPPIIPEKAEPPANKNIKDETKAQPNVTNSSVTPISNQSSSTAGNAPQANININISVPKIKKPTLPKVPVLPYKKLAKRGAIVLGILIILIGGGLAIKHFFFKPKPVVSTNTFSSGVGLTKPTFTPLAPTSNPKLASGASGTTFDGSKDTYSFEDDLDGTPFVVSQQPLPSGYSSSTNAVASIAKSMGANTQIAFNGNIAYMATNSKDNSQLIVSSINNILLLIQSNFPHASNDWGNYLSSLQ